MPPLAPRPVQPIGIPASLANVTGLAYSAMCAIWPSRKVNLNRYTLRTACRSRAAATAHRHLVAAVRLAQQRAALPHGDPERVAALLRATAHGAADLAIGGHLSPEGKGHADASELIDDLLDHIHPGRAGRAGRADLSGTGC